MSYIITKKLLDDDESICYDISGKRSPFRLKVILTIDRDIQINMSKNVPSELLGFIGMAYSLYNNCKSLMDCQLSFATCLDIAINNPNRAVLYSWSERTNNFDLFIHGDVGWWRVVNVVLYPSENKFNVEKDEHTDNVDRYVDVAKKICKNILNDYRMNHEVITLSQCVHKCMKEYYGGKIK